MPSPENYQNTQHKQGFVDNVNKENEAQPFANFQSDRLTEDLDGDPRLVATAFMNPDVYEVLINKS